MTQTAFIETEEQRALRKAVAAMAANYGQDYYLEKARSGGHTDELWNEAGKLGFIGVNLPEEYGGGGAGMVELAIVCEEAAAQGCPLLLTLVSCGIAAEVIGKFGSAGQKEQWLPRLASGEGKIVFAITEPDAGTNSHKISTTAVQDGPDWLISGQKYFISGVEQADAILVVTKTGTGADGKAQMSLFLVDTDAPGLVAQQLPVDVAMPDKQFTLFFDNVRVPAGRLIGTEGDGFRQVFHGLNPERITGAALCVGIGRFALAKAARYASERTIFKAPIGTYQGVSHPLAAAKIHVEAAALITAKAAWQHDHGEPAGEASNMAKYLAAEEIGRAHV